MPLRPLDHEHPDPSTLTILDFQSGRVWKYFCGRCHSTLEMVEPTAECVACGQPLPTEGGYEDQRFDVPSRTTTRELATWLEQQALPLLDDAPQDVVLALLERNQMYRAAATRLLTLADERHAAETELAALEASACDCRVDCDGDWAAVCPDHRALRDRAEAQVATIARLKQERDAARLQPPFMDASAWGKACSDWVDGIKRDERSRTLDDVRQIVQRQIENAPTSPIPYEPSVRRLLEVRREIDALAAAAPNAKETDSPT